MHPGEEASPELRAFCCSWRVCAAMAGHEDTETKAVHAVLNNYLRNESVMPCKAVVHHQHTRTYGGNRAHLL